MYPWICIATGGGGSGTDIPQIKRAYCVVYYNKLGKIEADRPPSEIIADLRTPSEIIAKARLELRMSRFVSQVS